MTTTITAIFTNRSDANGFASACRAAGMRSRTGRMDSLHAVEVTRPAGVDAPLENIRETVRLFNGSTNDLA